MPTCPPPRHPTLWPLHPQDFKKHCQGADMLREGLPGHHEEAVAALDLILRWSVLRLAEGNTQTLLSVLAMLKVRGSVCLGAGGGGGKVWARGLAPRSQGAPPGPGVRARAAMDRCLEDLTRPHQCRRRPAAETLPAPPPPRACARRPCLSSSARRATT
jgi:hypothetical protein